MTPVTNGPMSSAISGNKSKQTRKRQHLWLIYGAALLAGGLLLADAVDYSVATRLTAKFGIGLLYSALAFLVAGKRPSAIIATILLWTAIILTFVF